MKQYLKQLQSVPDEMVAEVSKLYEIGLESYEVDYIISLRKRE